MKALSVKQPWAWLIVNGYKEIENRNWPTAHRGRIFIHASKQVDNSDNSWDFIKERIDPKTFKKLREMTFPRGCLVGEVDLIGCTTNCGNQWFVGAYGFTFAYPECYDRPIPYPGRLGLFNVERFPE